MDEPTENAIHQVLVIATTAAQMSAATALMLKAKGFLQPPEAEHLAMLARHLGESFQAYGDDDLASDFGATAASLRLPPPA